MRRIVLAALALSFGCGDLCGAHAQESALRRLDTGDDGRGWEAVGRLELPSDGFCTGALIEPDLVLTAAHCLFDSTTGTRLDEDRIEFLAGWRNGRASAYRRVRRVVVHPDYIQTGEAGAERVRNDLALLELRHPVRDARVVPFLTAESPRADQRVAVVSYAKERSDAPSLQEECTVIAHQKSVLVMSCDIDHGSSGAPVFAVDGGEARIVSVISAKAEVDGQKISLGTQLQLPLEQLKAALAARQSPYLSNVTDVRDTGAKFARP